MDPLTTLRNHCVFESEKDVYILMALARAKDNDALTPKTEIVFREVIRKREDIERKYNQLKGAAEGYMGGKYNFYLYVTANPRDAVKAFFQLQHMMIDYMKEYTEGRNDVLKRMRRMDGMWMKALAKPGSKVSERSRIRFVLDYDHDDRDALDNLCNLIRKDAGEGAIIRIQKTKNGWHVLTKAFDHRIIEKFPKELKDKLEVKHDAMIFIEHIQKKYPDRYD